MRILKIIFIACVVGVAGWWLWENEHEVTQQVSHYVGKGDILTLEARFSPEKIMEIHRGELLEDELHKFQDSFLKFHPYLLMDVKYHLADQKTHEGVILWGMENGEMVLNAETWELTHGFEDCLVAGATRNDFKIINILAKHNGALTREELLNALHVEADTLDLWVDSVREKHLVVQKGNEYRLHFQNPKLQVLPQTKIKRNLVTKPYLNASRVSKKYSSGQIEKTAKALFGTDFTIRSGKEVFLPVIGINVLNPDGSILTSYWNALTGQRITPQYLSEE